MEKDYSKVCATCHYFNPRTHICIHQLMLGFRPVVVHSLSTLAADGERNRKESI